MVLAHADFFLHLVTERLEVSGERLAGRIGPLRRLASRREIAAHAHADDYRAEITQRLRHAAYAQLPAAIAGHEDGDTARLSLGDVDGDRTETPCGQVGRVVRIGACGRRRCGRCDRGRGGSLKPRGLTAAEPARGSRAFKRSA